MLQHGKQHLKSRPVLPQNMLMFLQMSRGPEYKKVTFSGVLCRGFLPFCAVIDTRTQAESLSVWILQPGVREACLFLIQFHNWSSATCQHERRRCGYKHAKTNLRQRKKKCMLLRMLMVMIIMMMMMKRTQNRLWGVDKDTSDNDDEGLSISLGAVLPAGRDLLLESPCKVKRFRALAAEWPDWLAEVSTERAAKREEEAGVSAAGGKNSTHTKEEEEEWWCFGCGVTRENTEEPLKKIGQ